MLGLFIIRNLRNSCPRAFFCTTSKLRARITYGVLSSVFEAIEKERSRLRILSLLSDFYGNVITNAPQDLLTAVYLSCNQLGPPYKGIVLGLGENIIQKALSEFSGESFEQIAERYRNVGDLGVVASDLASIRTEAAIIKQQLTLRKVFDSLHCLATVSGKDSVAVKVQIVAELLFNASPSEAKYLTRSCLGKLRLGLAERSVLASLARAIVLSSAAKVTNDNSVSVENKKEKDKELENEIAVATRAIQSAHAQVPSFDLLIPVLLRNRHRSFSSSSLLKSISITIGVPTKVMLAQPVSALEDVRKRFGEHRFSCEYKYDGIRAQVHVERCERKAKLYTRNLDDVTEKFPDVISAVQHALHTDVQNAIIEGEIVAIDIRTKELLPFQVLAARKIKNIDLDSIEVAVCFFAFDMIFLNNEPLLNRAFLERRTLLHSSFTEEPGHFEFACSTDDTVSTDSVTEFYYEALRSKCEGVMCKNLLSEYECGKRAFSVLKLKNDYVNGAADSFDLVPIGGYYGKGKRVGVLGAFLMACFDAESGNFQSVCRLGSGFTEKDLREASATLLASRVAEKPLNYEVSVERKLVPDVWFEPTTVWEVKAAQLTISPQHTAGLNQVKQRKGVALRFPRFVRHRFDKGINEATSAQQLVEAYNWPKSPKTRRAT